MQQEMLQEYSGKQRRADGRPGRQSALDDGRIIVARGEPEPGWVDAAGSARKPWVEEVAAPSTVRTAARGLYDAMFSQEEEAVSKRCFGWLKTIAALMRKARHRGTLKARLNRSRRDLQSWYMRRA